METVEHGQGQQRLKTYEIKNKKVLGMETESLSKIYIRATLTGFDESSLNKCKVYADATLSYMSIRTMCKPIRSDFKDKIISQT